MSAGARSFGVMSRRRHLLQPSFPIGPRPVTKKSRKLIATFDDRESRYIFSDVLNIALQDRETIKVGGFFGCNGSTRWIGCLSDVSRCLRSALLCYRAEAVSLNESGTLVKRCAMTGDFPNSTNPRSSRREKMQSDFNLLFAHRAQLRMSEQRKDCVDRASETIMDRQNGHISGTLADGQSD